MNAGPLQLAIVYPGDAELRRHASPENNRFAPLFAAFAARGAQVEPAVYDRAQTGELRDRLLRLDGVLVWVNPIEAGHSRAPLDALLREVAAAGVFVSAHPDAIMKLGTKDVLVETREMGWGSDAYRLDTPEQLRNELPGRLEGKGARVLKQWRGHSGAGVWRVQRLAEDVATGTAFRVRTRHAQRGSAEEAMSFEDFAARMDPYFADGGHMVDQAWQPRLVDGMVRCYLVGDRVVGFGLQAVNALYPAPAGGSEPAPAPGPRLYHPPDLPHLQALRHRLELEWIPELRRRLAIAPDELPLLWDCDFLHGEPRRIGEERHVLCEINVSSVAPFPDSAIDPLVAATMTRLERARAGRTAGP